MEEESIQKIETDSGLSSNFQGYFLFFAAPPSQFSSCCRQESACFSFSLLLSIFPQFFSPSLNLLQKRQLIFSVSPLHLCLRSKHADVFTTCKEKEMFQKQKEIFHLAVPQDLFFPEEHFQGEKLYISAGYISEENQIGVQWTPYHQSWAEAAAWSNKQDSASGCGGMSKLKTTGISCVGLLGCGVVARAVSS